MSIQYDRFGGNQHGSKRECHSATFVVPRLWGPCSCKRLKKACDSGHILWTSLLFDSQVLSSPIAINMAISST